MHRTLMTDFDDWLVAHGYLRSSHAGIPETSTMRHGPVGPSPRMKGTRLTEEVCVIENRDHEEKVAELINGGKTPR